jgi:mRNA interferase RelE/StbE
MARISLTNQAERDVKALAKDLAERVRNAVRSLGDNPLKGTALSGPYKGLSRYRVGDFRIVYEFDSRKDSVLIIKIRHRGEAYR